MGFDAAVESVRVHEKMQDLLFIERRVYLDTGAALVMCAFVDCHVVIDVDAAPYPPYACTFKNCAFFVHGREVDPLTFDAHWIAGDRQCWYGED